MGRIQVFVVPFGRVTLDGRPIDVRRAYSLRPGSYRVVATYEGHRQARTVRLEAGRLERVTFRFIGDAPR